MLNDPSTCTHPLPARRLGGRVGVTIVCMLCGCRADSPVEIAPLHAGRIH